MFDDSIEDEGMSAHEDLSRTPDAQGSSNRGFGLVFAAAFVVVGMLPVLGDRPARRWALAIGGAFLMAALLAPAVLSPLNRVWTRFGLLLGRITNPVILGILFYGVFTPFGLLLRLMRKDLLGLDRGRDRHSYWIHREPPGPAPDSMRNQF